MEERGHVVGERTGATEKRTTGWRMRDDKGANRQVGKRKKRSKAKEGKLEKLI